MAAVKKGDTVVIAGTRKGLFVFHSRDRKTWSSRGPFFQGLPVRHAILDPEDGRTLYAGVTSEHWGPIVARTRDFGGKWDVPNEGPRFSKESGLSVTHIWQLQSAADDGLYVGVEPAGLFRSTDRGETWSSVDGLNYRPGRDKWEPGGGGLCLHTILPYPGDPKRMLIGISSAGIFGTNDAGDSWTMYDAGIRYYGKQDVYAKEDLGTCVHKMVRDARDPAILYQQNHAGMHRRARGDPAWKIIETGLPISKSTGGAFGFPIAAHPHDGATAYAVPLVGDNNRVTPNGAMAVYRTTNGGKRWEKRTKGFPQQDAWFTVLRDGLRTDSNDPAGVYVGTTTGQLYASRDDGESWRLIADHLPQVQSVEAGVVGGA
jgi:hypothetical protein